MRSIRARLLLTLLVSISSAMLLAGILLYWIVRHNLEARFHESLLTQAHALGSLVVYEDATIELEAASGEGLPACFMVTLGDGTILASAGRFEWNGGQFIPVSRGETRLTRVEFPNDDEDEIEEADAVIVAVRPRAEHPEDAPYGGAAGRNDEPVTVTVVGSRDPLEDTLETVTAAIIGTGALVLLITWASVWWSVRRGLRPLDRFAAKLGHVRADAPTPMAEDGPVPSELIPVHAALDSMLGRIKQTTDREIRFTDAAAHELRTPIAELRTMLDVARRWPEPERMRATLSNADEVVERMDALVNALLMLSRNPAALSDHPGELVAVASMVSGELERFRGPIESGNIRITQQLSACRDWMMPEAPMILVIHNLLANAVEYTPPGGEINIRCDRSDTGRALSISNGPVEMNAAQCDRLFEPFWRAQQSRSGRVHHGLGLAVVEHVCAACGMACIADCSGDRLMIRISEHRA